MSNCFVITRSADGGKTILDYLSKDNDYTWVESGAIARWFHSEEEAQIHLDTGYSSLKLNKNLFIRPYDPIDTLVNPTETDRNVMVQNVLKGMLEKPVWEE